MTDETERAQLLAAHAGDPVPPPADEKPRRRNRPTTREGRRQAAAARADKTPRQPRNTAAQQSRRVAEGVAQLHALGGATAAMLGRPATGAALAASAPDAGAAWAQLAERYPAVAAVFTGGADAMVWLKLLMVYAPIVQTALTEKRDPNAAADVSTLLSHMGFSAAGADDLAAATVTP